ncbi:hypothetical protein TTHERM_000796732 (macronuclear) [Tetrahymena thermophila SB210]|uniref:Uncharacterized protein n=1 Tax=Tetrahymena thermophila (strain SB210) TaxID=312017 RepID=W7XGP2_TETTS|nr:hypothetical protein TTHERM_000796732 [Tetrahymena thermophila SB210]EWS73341.1 hypothetical protein TTHERM_000796732 [Tetrahymena thermophila SB210]|eukprot:XP_012654113.1 hypothetical protein TTHERM_000796732 [Tetrahymena thermophila SB210]
MILYFSFIFSFQLTNQFQYFHQYLKSYNQIGAIGASGLGSGLGKCTNLSNLTLHLHFNKIGNEGALGLGSGLGNCTNIQNLTLDLYGNEINKQQQQQLKVKCLQSKRLVVLKLKNW